MTLIKYPKTLHLPWSEGIQNDDKVMSKVPFDGQEVVVTEKMDGENTTMYHDHIHARSLDSRHHPSRDWVKSFWSTFKHEIPPDMRICGENMFAVHSISYDDLLSYFLGFSVWNKRYCCSWDTTVEWFEIFGITPVPVLYEGVYKKDVLDELWANMNPARNEGYVVRLRTGFNLDSFQESVGKYVRKDHVQTDDRLWSLKPVVPNKRKPEL
jgi:hypothetical protein